MSCVFLASIEKFCFIKISYTTLGIYLLTESKCYGILQRGRIRAEKQEQFASDRIRFYSPNEENMKKLLNWRMVLRFEVQTYS